MVILISKNEDPNFAIEKIKETVYNNLDLVRLIDIGSKLNIEAFQVLRKSLDNFVIHRYDKYYAIDINKDININGKSLDQLINMITYGSLSVKGYPIIREAVESLRYKYLEG